ncbi:PREDICTED: endothelin-converting enzyme 1-like isoform X2 [Dinoponera quadriceps]|nr:PREDICTED: endothelin-converting enzyme 1-like isoform X2 [Dinoponera quadriceps]
MTFLPLLFCVIIAGAVGLPRRRSTEYTVCESEVCRKVGESIRRDMNDSYEPCTNFYEYGCGLRLENNRTQSNDVEWSEKHILDLKSRISHRLKEILEEQSEYDDLPPIKMMKQYYRSCIDEDAIEKHGLEPIQKLLDAKGGWPIQLGNHEASNYTWQEVDDYYLQMFLASSFIAIRYTPQKENATNLILTVKVGTTYFLMKTIGKKRFVYWETDRLVNVLRAFKRHIGTDVPIENYIADISDIIKFSRNFRNISQYEMNAKKVNEQDYDIMTIAELQGYYDLAGTQQPTAQVNLLQKIQLLFKSSNITVDVSTPVLVQNKHLLHQLAHLLGATPPHVIVNYIHWNVVNQFLPYLTKEMRDINFETTYMEYITKQKPRWEICVEDTGLEEALSFLFIKKYNMENMITGVTEMLDNIKTEMKRHILNSTWTSASAKHFMIDKIDNVISLIGYSNWYNNQTALIEYYEGLEVGESYFKNKVATTVFKTKRILKDYLKPMNRTKWIFAPITFNAAYAHQMNSMIIPAAVVQDPYFAPDIPLAINYGAIGMIIGHELAHSVDSTGMKYNKFGNEITMDVETAQAYKERMKCFIDQYNNYTLTAANEYRAAIQLDGVFTRNENIADNIGLEIAFAAFQRHKLTAGSQPRLTGLTDINDEQLFFLSFANS